MVFSEAKKGDFEIIYDEIENENSFETIVEIIHSRTEGEWRAYYNWLQDKRGSFANRMFHHGLKIFLYPLDRIAKNSRYTTYGKAFYFSKPYQLRWDGSRCKEYITHIDFYDSYYRCLGDDKSKEVMLCLLKYALNDDEKYFSQVNDSNEIQQYFDPSIFIRENKETFLDCGAYIGDTVINYMEHYGTDEDRIISFELDDENIRKYQENTSCYSHITLINKGVWDRADVMVQAGDGSGSSVAEHVGGKCIEVDTIDNMVNVPISFIKMDIEGAEEKALEGASHHILNDTPKLAICVYHKVDDIRTLSNTIDSIKDGYKYYLRHYTDSFMETVMYAKYEG